MRRSLGGRSMIAAALLSATMTLAGPDAEAADCASYYTVVAGDSWSRVSHRTGIYIRPLAAANGMTRDDTLLVGASLCVPVADSSNSPPQPTTARQGVGGAGSPRPSAASSATTSAPRQPTGAAPSSCVGTPVVVRRGESWFVIAKAGGISLNALLRANAAAAATPIFPDDVVCVPAPQAPTSSPNPTTAPATTVQASGPKADCAAALATYKRVLCMDLSDRYVVIGGNGETTFRFQAVAGYGTVATCTKTVAGTFWIGAKTEITPRKRLKWGMSFGGGCIGDQIVHTVGRGTMNSQAGTAGCIGLYEADALTAYETMRIGDPIVIVD